MKRSFLVLLIISFSGLLLGQPYNRLGNPLVTNFTPEDYNGTEQNWSITEDSRGVMYFGTYDSGILEFDGKTWRKISVPDNKPVYSMVKGDDDVIYVGTSGDFGFLEPTNNGSLEYISLSQNINDTIKQTLSHIYKTYSSNNNIYFCSQSYLFIYNGKNIVPVYYGSQSIYANFLTFLANNTIYIGSYLKGLRMLTNNNTLTEAPGGKKFEHINIFSIVSISTKELLIITDNGFYKYYPETGESKQVDNPNRFVKSMLEQSVIPYYAIELNNGNFGVGTVQSDWLSFIEITPSLDPVNIVNPKTGLQTAQVTCLYQNHESPVWLTLFDGGISKIEIHSAIRKFAKESGIDDIILDIIRFNGTLYVATFNGVYYLDFDKKGMPHFVPVDGITGIVWSLTQFNTPGGKPKLLAGSYVDGVFEIIKGQAISISEPLSKVNPDVQHKCYYLYQSPSKPNMLYIGMSSGLAYIKWDKGEWVETKNIARKDIRFEIRSIGEDKEGNLWLGSSLNGLFLISKEGKILNFNENNGLPNQKQLQIFPFNDSLFILSSKGVFHYNYKDSTFEQGGLINSSSDKNGIYRMAKTESGFAVLNYNETDSHGWVNLLDKSSGTWTIIDKPFKRLPNKWADAIFADNDGTIWVGMSKELYSYNPEVKRTYSTPFRALIRKVIAKDSLLLDGCYYSINNSGKRLISTEQQASQTYKLPFRYNGIVINFVAPYFEKEEDIQYCHYLEGSDEEDWSKWDSKTDATYTNLREGKYTFHVKAKNIYGDESIPATYSFEIKPPWYRTIIAYIFYTIIAILLVWAIVKWNTRRLIAEKERLEQIVKERTAEVVAQKEEIEVQKEKIAVQNEEIKSSILYASRIQGAILTPSEQVAKIFPDSFILYLPRDIVSGDFYYITQVGSKKISVVADCTGHGVPGGFMSMLGMSFLSQIISQNQDLHPATILNQLRQQVINALHQTGEIGGSKDGMDIAIYIYDEQKMTLEFSGANNPLIHIHNGELNHIKSDKMPIGIHLRGDISFTNFEVEIHKGDVLYTFSDGYADQFGGTDARKFMIKNLKDLLLEIHQKPMAEQREILNQTLLNWHGNNPRIDDVVVMGMRIV